MNKFKTTWMLGVLNNVIDWHIVHIMSLNAFEKIGLKPTHFATCSDTFKGGKYLVYSRGRNRLEKSIARNENRKYLEYLEVRDGYITMIQDHSISIQTSESSKVHGQYDVQIDIRLDHYAEGILNQLECDFINLFSSVRILRFKSPNNKLPCNFTNNYDNRNVRDEIVREFIDVSLETR